MGSRIQKLKARLENRSRRGKEAGHGRERVENPPPYVGGYRVGAFFKQALNKLGHMAMNALAGSRKAGWRNYQVTPRTSPRAFRRELLCATLLKLKRTKHGQ